MPSHKAVYYAILIASCWFWSGRKNKYHSRKIGSYFSFGDGARVVCFFACVIQQLVFLLSKLKLTSTTAVSGAPPGALPSALDSIIQAYAHWVWSGRDETWRGASRGHFSTKQSSPAAYVVWLRWGAATAFAHHGCIHSPTHWSLLVLLCVPGTAAVVPGRLCSVRFLLD